MISRRLARLIAGPLLLVLGLLIACVAGELFLRAFPGFLPADRRAYLRGDDESAGVADPYIGHLQHPNSHGVISGTDFRAQHTTDAHGFRNRNPWPSRADIVVLGDSLAFGYGVDDNESWPAILDHSFTDLKVVNLALIGAGPEQYRRVYRVYAEPLRPRLVIVGMFTGNDFWDAGMFDRWLRSGVKGNYMTWRNYGRTSSGAWGTVKKDLIARSYLFNLVLAGYQDYRVKREGGTTTMKLKDGSNLQLLPGEQERLTAGAVPGTHEFELVVRSLTRLKQATDRENSQLLLVLQPSKEEVYLPVLGMPVRDSSAALRPVLDRLKIPYVNLLPVFRVHAEKGEKLFFESDGHPDGAGYELIASSVEQYLVANKDVVRLTPGHTVFRLDQSGGIKSQTADPRSLPPQSIRFLIPAGRRG